MPSWNAILKEIQSDPNIDPFRNVRQKYIQQLFKKRQRNIIVYYSGWLQKPGIRGIEMMYLGGNTWTVPPDNLIF